MTTASLPRPAAATTTDPLSGAAAVAGVVLNQNWRQNQAQPNTVVGYTPNGGVVYADGRIVTNGRTYYASNNGRTRCSYIADGRSACSSTSRGYAVAPRAWRSPKFSDDRSLQNHHSQDNGNHKDNGRHNGEGNDNGNDNGRHHGEKDNQR